MKSTWFSRPEHYAFCKKIDEGTPGGSSMWDAIGLFLEMTYLSLSQRGREIAGLEKLPEKEARYMEVAARCKKPGAMAEAFAILTMDFQENGPSDFLGDVLGSLGQLDKSCRGQCFTPWPICQLMAKMTMPGKEARQGNHRLSISEPACGGGAMVMASHVHLLSVGFRPWEYYFDATDVDFRCFCMSFIQLSLAGVPAIVRHGNTLSLELWETDVTTALRLWPIRAERKKKPRRRAMPESLKQKMTTP